MPTPESIRSWRSWLHHHKESPPWLPAVTGPYCPDDIPHQLLYSFQSDLGNLYGLVQPRKTEPTRRWWVQSQGKNVTVWSVRVETTNFACDALRGKNAGMSTMITLTVSMYVRGSHLFVHHRLAVAHWVLRSPQDKPSPDARKNLVPRAIRGFLPDSSAHQSQRLYLIHKIWPIIARYRSAMKNRLRRSCPFQAVSSQGGNKQGLCKAWTVSTGKFTYRFCSWCFCCCLKQEHLNGHVSQVYRPEIFGFPWAVSQWSVVPWSKARPRNKKLTSNAIFCISTERSVEYYKISQSPSEIRTNVCWQLHSLCHTSGTLYTGNLQ